jgi:hypothetical protein
MSAPCYIELECTETMCKNDLCLVQNDTVGVWEALFEDWRRQEEPGSATSERILRMLEQYKNDDPCSSDSEIGDTDRLDCVYDDSPELSPGNEIAEGFSDFYGGGL